MVRAFLKNVPNEFANRIDSSRILKNQLLAMALVFSPVVLPARRARLGLGETTITVQQPLLLLPLLPPLRSTLLNPDKTMVLPVLPPTVLLQPKPNSFQPSTLAECENAALVIQ